MSGWLLCMGSLAVGVGFGWLVAKIREEDRRG